MEQIHFLSILFSFFLFERRIICVRHWFVLFFLGVMESQLLCAQLWCNWKHHWLRTSGLSGLLSSAPLTEELYSSQSVSEWVRWKEFLSIPLLKKKINAVCCFVLIEQIITSRCASPYIKWPLLYGLVKARGGMEVRSDLFTLSH